MRHRQHQLVLAVPAATVFGYGSDPETTTLLDSATTIEAEDRYFSAEQVSAPAGDVTIV